MKGLKEDQIIISKPYATIYELNNIENENCVRIYGNGRMKDKTGEVDTFINLQIRTKKPITEYGKGKERNMLANVSLSLTELKQIVEYAESLYK